MKKKTFLFSSFIEGTKLGQTVLDISLLKKLWTPLIKVKLSHHSFLIISNLQIRHIKSSSTDVGLSYGGRGIGIVNNGGIAMLQYWEPTRAEISCPMDFWNYPFDTQFCHFILEPLNWDFQLVNSPYLKSSQLDDQNIKMSYDIEIVPLPPDLLVRHPDPVSFSCLYMKLSFILSPECFKYAGGIVSRCERLQSQNCGIHIQADKEIQQVHLHLLHSQVESQQKVIFHFLPSAAFVLSLHGDPS